MSERSSGRANPSKQAKRRRRNAQMKHHYSTGVQKNRLGTEALAIAFGLETRIHGSAEHGQAFQNRWDRKRKTNRHKFSKRARLKRRKARA